MKRVSVWVGLLLLSSLARSEEPGPAERLADLLNRMKDDDPLVREAAGAALDRWCVEAREGAREHLRKALASADAEITGRLNAQIAFLNEVEALRKDLEFIERMELPDCCALDYVQFNTGQHGYYGTPDKLEFRLVIGWLVASDDTQVTLMTDTPSVRTFRRDTSLPERWEEFKDALPEGQPLPGQWRKLSFNHDALELLGEGSERRAFSFGHHKAVEAAVVAHWSLQRGMWREALELRALSKKCVEAGIHSRDPKDAHDRLLRWLAIRVVAEGIFEGAEGRDRAALEKRWAWICRVAPEKWIPPECLAYAEHYASMAAEDAAWKDVPRDVLDRRPSSERVTYWMYRLRDQNASQGFSGDACFIVGANWQGPPTPADELVKLDWDALPALVEHLDDRRPTRALRWWKGISLEEYEHWTYGDCCASIFRAITGLDLREAAGRGAEPEDLKKLAEKWLKDHAGADRERHWLGLLPRNPGFAAEKLLEADAEKHLPALVAKLDMGGSGAVALVRVLKDRLKPEHTPILKKQLFTATDEFLREIAPILWRLNRDEEGLLELIRRLRTLKAGDSRVFHLEFAANDIVEGPPESVGPAVAEFLNHVDPEIRSRMLFASRHCAHARVAETLADLVDERALDPEDHSRRARFCDTAAQSLAWMLRFELAEGFHKADEESRDAEIARLKAWYTAHRSSLDWEALRKPR